MSIMEYKFIKRIAAKWKPESNDHFSAGVVIVVLVAKKYVKD